ncbi:hypothetical protein LPA46_17445 [Halobacterium sp. KA-6]|nr:hypothetical protein [Halobacterium sp. KA-6]MCD2205109.1 hypothetical protein [Halobacterium sp. KA-6]
MGEFLGFLPGIFVLCPDFRFQGLGALPAEENERILVVAMPNHDENVVVRVVLEKFSGLERRDVTACFDVNSVVEHLEVIGSETLGVAAPNSLLVFPIPHLDREVFTTELLEREFTEIPDTFDIDVVSALDDGLVMGAFTINNLR